MPRPDANINHVGIFGRRLSGKSRLGRELIGGHWDIHGTHAIILAPLARADDWPPWAWVTKDRDAWLEKAWASWGCNVVCDDASMTINRDRELSSLFTCIGHRAHRLFVLGHGPADLLPAMRRQLTELYLYRQSRSEVQLWVEEFADEALLRACTLDFQRHQFLHVVLGQSPECFESVIRRGRLEFRRMPEDSAPIEVGPVPFRPLRAS